MAATGKREDSSMEITGTMLIDSNFKVTPLLIGQSAKAAWAKTMTILCKKAPTDHQDSRDLKDHLKNMLKGKLFQVVNERVEWLETLQELKKELLVSNVLKIIFWASFLLDTF